MLPAESREHALEKRSRSSQHLTGDQSVCQVVQYRTMVSRHGEFQGAEGGARGQQLTNVATTSAGHMNTGKWGGPQSMSRPKHGDGTKKRRARNGLPVTEAA
jgi:hypothetical protein